MQPPAHEPSLTDDGGRHQSWSVLSLMTTLFDALESKQVTYAVLRFDEALLRPDTELDLLVRPGALAEVLSEIRALCARFAGLRLAYWHELPRHAATVIFAWRDADGAYRSYFLDIRCGIRKRGIVVFDGADLDVRHTAREPLVGARCLRRDLEQALLLVRNALDARTPNQRHMRILAGASSEKLSATMRKLGFRADRLGVHSGWRLLMLPAVPRAVWASIRYGTRSMLGRTRRMALGMNVVLYGPDGVGKSTHAALLGDFFRGARVSRVTVYHSFVEASALRERATRRVQVAKRRVYQGAGRGRAIAAIILVSYAKKLLKVLFVYRRRARRGHIAIHDRHLLDVFQKAWKSVGVRFPKLERLLLAVTPREPFLFVLEADAEVVAARTGELEPQEVMASYEALFEALRASSSKATLIDANRPIGAVQRDLLAAVLKTQTERCLAIGDGRQGPIRASNHREDD